MATELGLQLNRKRPNPSLNADVPNEAPNGLYWRGPSVLWSRLGLKVVALMQARGHGPP